MDGKSVVTRQEEEPELQGISQCRKKDKNIVLNNITCRVYMFIRQQDDQLETVYKCDIIQQTC